ncbi:RNA-binding protein, partial [Candidatus Phytoplasma fabacearum]
MEKSERRKEILQNFKRFEQRSFSVFVDYLSYKVNIQWLWDVFSRVGQVVDVYISRKIRKNNPTRFAFVRFGFRNHASRAVQLLNGNRLDGKTIVVSESKYGRSEIENGYGKYQGKHDHRMEINRNEINDKDVPTLACNVKEKSAMSYKDAVVKDFDKTRVSNKMGEGMENIKSANNEVKVNNVNEMKECSHCPNRRKIEVLTSLKQKELLSRSVLAES